MVNFSSVLNKSFKVVSQSACLNPFVILIVNSHHSLSSVFPVIPSNLATVPFFPSLSLLYPTRPTSSPKHCQWVFWNHFSLMFCFGRKNSLLDPSILRQFVQILHSLIAIPIGSTSSHEKAQTPHYCIPVILVHSFLRWIFVWIHNASPSKVRLRLKSSSKSMMMTIIVVTRPSICHVRSIFSPCVPASSKNSTVFRRLLHPWSLRNLSSSDSVIVFESRQHFSIDSPNPFTLASMMELPNTDAHSLWIISYLPYPILTVYCRPIPHFPSL